MTLQVVCSERAGVSLDCPLSGETLSELISYILGFYNSLFAGSNVQFPASAGEFVYDVLRQGYGLTESSCVDASERFVINEHLIPIEDLQSAHTRFRDPNAWRFIIAEFTKVF